MQNHKVKVYTTKICPHCNHLKDFLKEHNIAFEEIDVGSDRKAAQELIKKTNAMAVPIIEINGKFIIGFDKKAISNLLGL